MWVTPDSGTTEWRRPASVSARESRSVFATKTLSSARPWIRRRGLTRFGASPISEFVAIDLRLLLREPEVPLGVGRVVQHLLRVRRAGHRGVEDVRPPKDRQRREVAAERPSADADLVQVEESEAIGRRMESVDLVLEHGAGEILGRPRAPTRRHVPGCHDRRRPGPRSPGRPAIAARGAPDAP